jgi:hypothetical protein
MVIPLLCPEFPYIPIWIIINLSVLARESFVKVFIMVLPMTLNLQITALPAEQRSLNADSLFSGITAEITLSCSRLLE